MDKCDGELFSGSDALATGVRFWIETVPGRRLSSWRGSFELPKENTFSFIEHRQCEIVLSDGRKGTIVVTRAGHPLVTFQGSGPLE